jgi:GFO/IDH/MocA oxidoreductase family protein
MTLVSCETSLPSGASELADVLDVRSVFPRISEITNKILPHDAMTMVFHDGNGRVVQKAATEGVPALSAHAARGPQLDHFVIGDLTTIDLPAVIVGESRFEQADGHRKMLEFGLRHWFTNNEAGLGRGLFSRHNAIGNIFYGSRGYLAAGNEDSFSYESWLGADQGAGPHGKSGNDHFANFIGCVRSRNVAELHAPIEEGHVSCALVHLANASYRLGRALRFDAETERVIDDEEANRLLSDADRSYRAPFVVPDVV